MSISITPSDGRTRQYKCKVCGKLFDDTSHQDFCKECIDAERTYQNKCVICGALCYGAQYGGCRCEKCRRLRRASK